MALARANASTNAINSDEGCARRSAVSVLGDFPGSIPLSSIIGVRCRTHADFDQLADGFRPGGRGALRFAPAIERGELVGLQSNLHGGALTCWLWPAFLWLQGLLTDHINHDTRVSSRSKVGPLPRL